MAGNVEGFVFTVHSTSLVVNFGETNRDGCVVLGTDKLTAHIAAPRNVHINKFSGFVLHFRRTRTLVKLIQKVRDDQVGNINTYSTQDLNVPYFSSSIFLIIYN